jgi:epoxyqueuosine reductase
MGRQVFGCDICQDVCPWNRKAPWNLGDPELSPKAELINPDLAWLADLREEDFERLFNGSPVRRAGFLGLRRNIAIAMGNSGLTRFLPWLERWAQVEDGDASTRAAVSESARWALSRLAPVEKRQDARND